MKDKDTSKIRTNWTRQERNSKGHFMPYKKEYKSLNELYEEVELSKANKIGIDIFKSKQDQSIDINAIEHAFYAGLKANNSFYPPSKLWEFYKRDKGL
jgi:hypothetical protein